MTAITLNLRPTIDLTDEQFEQICQANLDLRFERTAKGELIVMPPTGGETGKSNWGLAGQLWLWNHQSQLGVGFDSSTGFKLPNGATRSPDVAWVRRDRWEVLTAEQKQKFPPLCPDFVLELLSSSDDLAQLQAKMREYLENGASLGWLINPKAQQVEIYRVNQPVEILNQPTTISGESILPGLTMNLVEIWS